MQTPEHPDYQIIVTKGNPSRGWGYEIAHFINARGALQNLPEKDCFVPNMKAAIRWIHSHYPYARRIRCRRNRLGEVAAICFECSDAVNNKKI